MSRRGPTSRCSSGYVNSGKVNYGTEAARDKSNDVRPLRPAQSNRPGPSTQWAWRLFTKIFKYQKRNICYCGQLKVLSYQAGKLYLTTMFPVPRARGYHADNATDQTKRSSLGRLFWSLSPKQTHRHWMTLLNDKPGNQLWDRVKRTLWEASLCPANPFLDLKKTRQKLLSSLPHSEMMNSGV